MVLYPPTSQDRKHSLLLPINTTQYNPAISTSLLNIS